MKETHIPELIYDANSHSATPIPEGERNLQTVIAVPYCKVSDEGIQLEGPSFDRNGNLYFVEVFGGRIFRLTPDKQLSTILPANRLGSAGLAIHKDGRIFIAGLGDFTKGSVSVMNPDGSGLETIVPESAGYLVDDLVFDRNGGFYFTDFRGSSTNLAGGVYYVSADFQEVTCVLPNLGIANGIALSPDGHVLWVTESANNRLHRIELANATTIAPFGAGVPFYFAGGLGPDSMRADIDGNIYVAIYGQGRVLVLNRIGIPIGQILLPGRDSGHNLRCTSMAFRPGTNEMMIVTNDWDGGEGSWIFTCKGFNKGICLYSHQ